MFNFITNKRTCLGVPSLPSNHANTSATKARTWTCLEKYPRHQTETQTCLGGYLLCNQSTDKNLSRRLFFAPSDSAWLKGSQINLKEYARGPVALAAAATPAVVAVGSQKHCIGGQLCQNPRRLCPCQHCCWCRCKSVNSTPREQTHGQTMKKMVANGGPPSQHTKLPKCVHDQFRARHICASLRTRIAQEHACAQTSCATASLTWWLEPFLAMSRVQ